MSYSISLHDMQDGTAALTLLSCYIIIMHHDHDDDAVRREVVVETVEEDYGGPVE
jgi:hypothetical protein